MKHIIINVGRQVGAGGQEIGRMLAKDFDAKFYDRELLNLAASDQSLVRQHQPVCLRSLLYVS